MDKESLLKHGISTHSTRALLMHRAIDRGEHIEFLISKRKKLPYLSVITASGGVPVFVPRPSASGADKVTREDKKMATFVNLAYWGEQAIGFFSEKDLSKTTSPIMDGIKEFLESKKGCAIPNENLVSANPNQVVPGLKILFEGDVAVTPVMSPSLAAYLIEKITRIVSRRADLEQESDEGKKNHPFVRNIALFDMGSVGLGGSNGQNVGFPQALFERNGPGTYSFMLYAKHPGIKRSGEHQRLIWRMALSSKPFVPESLADKWRRMLDDAIKHPFLANGSRPFNAHMNNRFIERVEALAAVIVDDVAAVAKKMRASVPCDKANNDFARYLICPKHKLSEDALTFDMSAFLAKAIIRKLANSSTWKVDRMEHLKEMLTGFIKERLS